MDKMILDPQLIKLLSEKKVFIFDFDGTIVDADQAIFTGLKAVFEELNHPFTEQDYANLRGKPSHEYFLAIKKVAPENTDATEMIALFNKSCSDYYKEHNVQCYDYVKEAIEKFPDKKFVIASNNIQSFLQMSVNELGVGSAFSKIFACGNDINKKYIYENTYLFLGTHQKDCVLFENTQKYIDQAKEQNISTVAVVHRCAKEKLDADYYVNCNCHKHKQKPQEFITIN